MSDRCLYFGCWNDYGHVLRAPGGRRSALDHDFAWELSCKLDGQWAPRKGRSGKLCWQAQAPDSEDDRALGWELRDSSECPQGQFLLHQGVMGYTLIQWWDRCQGDKRGACNSTILLEGEHTTEELLAALTAHFPHVLANLEKAGVQLVEVFP